MPDHSILSRQSATPEALRPGSCRDGKPLPLLVDSTGLKFCGIGERLAEAHGTRARRPPRKLLMGVDAGTGQIVSRSGLQHVPAG